MLLIVDPNGRERTVVPVLISVYAVLFLLLAVVTFFGSKYGIPISQFTRDPVAVLRVYPFHGVISNIGILIWCSTSAICFFSSGIHISHGRSEISKFFMYSGLLTLVLLLDDLFLFHDYVFPKLFQIPQKAFYIGYFALFTMYCVRFRTAIYRSEYPLLLMACSFFGLSIACDLFLPRSDIEYLIEDGLKLFGIATWFVYFTRTCFMQIQQSAAGRD